MARAAVPAALALLVMAPARAEPPPRENGEAIEEIVISARRAGSAAAPSAFAVEIAADAPNRGLGIDEALRDAPGFSAFRRMDSRTAHPTTSTAHLLVKGPNATSRALVTVDGIPFNDPFTGAVAWAVLPPLAVESVTLASGPATGPFGDPGEGGVVAVRTRLAAPRPALALSAAGGSQQDAALAGFAATGGDRLALAAFGHGARSGGFHPVPKRLRGPVDRRADSRIAGGGAAVSGALGAARRWRWHMRALGFHDARNNGLAGADNATRGIETAAIITGAPGPRLEITAAGFHRRRLFRNRFVAVLDDARSLARPVLDQFRVPGRASGGNLDLAWTPRGASGFRLALGVDGETRRGATHERFRNLGAGFTRARFAGGETTRIGGYLDARLAPAPGWTLAAVLRLDGWRIGEGRERITDAASGRLLEETPTAGRRGAVATGGLTLRAPLGRDAAIDLSARRGWRLPTPNELFRPFRVGNTATLANADLAPERLEALQLALSGGRDGLTWRLAGHLGRLLDGIGNVTIGFGPGVFPGVGFLPADGILRARRNIPRIRITGIGWGVDVAPAAGTTLSFDGVFRDERITRAPAGAPELEGRRVAQAPRLRARARLRQELGAGLALALAARYEGRAFEDDRASLPLDRALTIDAEIAWTIAPAWRLRLAAENIFDATVKNAVAPDGFFTRTSPARVLLRLTCESG